MKLYVFAKHSCIARSNNGYRTVRFNKCRNLEGCALAWIEKQRFNRSGWM